LQDAATTRFNVCSQSLRGNSDIETALRDTWQPAPRKIVIRNLIDGEHHFFQRGATPVSLPIIRAPAWNAHLKLPNGYGAAFNDVRNVL